jgi:hypothetical protein
MNGLKWEVALMDRGVFRNMDIRVPVIVEFRSNHIYDAAKAIGNFALPYDEDGNIITTPGNMGGNGSVYTIIDEWKKSQDQREVARILGSFYAALILAKYTRC